MKKKIMLYTITVIVIVNIFVMSFSLNSIKNDYTLQKQNQLEVLTSSIAKSISLEGNDSMKNYEHVFNEYDIRATLISGDGEVVFETEDDPANMYNHGNRPEVLQAYEGKIGVDIRESNTLRESFLYVAAPVENSSYVIRLSTSLQNINSSMRDIIIRTVILIFISVVVASGVIIMLVERKFVRPIAKLANSSMEVKGSIMPEKVYYDGNDEIGDLYNKYNIMLERIYEEISNTNDTNLFLESILANMNSGVIALNHEREISFINRRGLDILGIKKSNFNHEKIINIIRDFEINEFIDAYYKSGDNSTSKFAYNDKIIKIIINILPLSYDLKNAKYGAVLLIEDISETYHLEEMRRNFAANVTHELKTPLTSIKGFVETIKNNEITDKVKLNRFMDIIDIEANRLRNLIDDILLLSEVESVKPTVEKFYFPSVMEEIKSLMLPIANDNNISVEYDIEDLYFESNLSRIKQLIIILIDNAIKYNMTDGKVFVQIRQDDSDIIIGVKDTGIGIDENNLSRIYERFYRVDKSRSRMQGGTGLGLAIAKHIVMSLDGKIKVESQLNQGTSFEIRFKKKKDK